MRFKIAVVQFRITQYEPEKNLERIERFIKTASGKADIIVFPEDFLTGGLSEKYIDKYADFNGRYKKIFQYLAKKYKIDIVAGSVIEGTKTAKYNTSYYIDYNGKVRGRYRKINLWLTERKHITSGNEISAFNTKYGKAGIVICWDLMFPEIFRSMARKGVKIVFCPSLWYRSGNFAPYKKYNLNAEIDHVNALCIARSVENNVIFIYANAVGSLKTSGGSFDEAIGQSQIAVPIKGILKRLEDKESMFIQEVDTSILKDEENAYRIMDDLKKRIHLN